MSPLRSGRPDDAAALAAIARAAYERYLPRMGFPPGPMLADYAAVLADAEVWVAEDDGTGNEAAGNGTADEGSGDGGRRPVGFVVLVEHPDHLLLENVAVHPAHQGRGIGRALLDHAETRARELGLSRVRLYTHETMTENLALYRARGYRETARAVEDVYRRVHLAKPLHPRSG